MLPAEMARRLARAFAGQPPVDDTSEQAAANADAAPGAAGATTSPPAAC
ncbi:hypothetical protein ACU610_09070 [Geodermatophilus sp. URMC 61]